MGDSPKPAPRPRLFSEWFDLNEEELRARQEELASAPRSWEEALDELLNPGLQIGKGATVTFRYAQQHARQLFAAALNRRIPTLTDSLVTPSALDLLDQVDDARSTLFACLEEWLALESTERSRSHPVEVIGPLNLTLVELQAKLDKHIASWQKRNRLEDDWVYQAAYLTLTVAYQVKSEGSPARVPLLVVDPGSYEHFGRERRVAPLADFPPHESAPRHEFTWAPLYIDDLKWSSLIPDDIEGRSGGLFAGFDLRTETVDDAVERILPGLEDRLRRALDAIVSEDQRINKTQPALVPFRKTNAFDWLVRFQVLQEDKSEIAKAEHKSSSQVSRAVNQVAALAGLKLRPESKGGRPKKTAPNTRKHVR